MDGAEKEMIDALQDMCEGSVEAFHRFYSHYAPFIMRITLVMLKDRMEAEDACHDIFLEVLRRGSSYNPQRGSIEAWLAVMTRSRCLDRIRKNQRVELRIEKDLQSDSLAHSSEDEAIRHLQQEAVVQALHGIPLNQRRAIVGSYFEAKSQRELAAAWDVPIGTVKSWVRYGVHNMRKQLERTGWMKRRHERGTSDETNSF